MKKYSHHLYAFTIYGQMASVTQNFVSIGNDAVRGFDYDYAYDPIGNRTSATYYDEQGEAVASAYSANALNQYTQRTVPGNVQVRGEADTDAIVTVNENPTWRDGEYFYGGDYADNTAVPVFKEVEIAAVVPAATPDGWDEMSAVTGRVFVAQNPEQFTYDADGNMTSDGRFRYTWNGENRLVRAQELCAPTNRNPYTLTYAYDHRGRMVSKRITENDGNDTLVKSVSYLWDGWNIIREIVRDGGESATVTDNIWGLDLDGTLQGAGGVGGLLAVVRHNSSTPNSSTHQLYYPTYDANGNISEYVSDSGEIAAHYDYSPFGEPLITSGDLAATFSHQFSTKPYCPMTGFSEYQLRKYRPDMGRWMSRDPLEEGEHLHLYTFIRNNQVNRSDYVGLADSTSAWQLGIEWLTGKGPRHHNFTDGDPFAEELRTHSNIREGLANATSQLALRCDNYNNSAFDFPHNYSLSGWEGIPKFIRDYSTVATGGVTGNLSAAYLGSYRARFYVTDIDCCKRTAHVLIIINNTSTAASGIRPPVIGYTQWWQDDIAPLINSAFSRGPGSTTTQQIELNENVTF